MRRAVLLTSLALLGPLSLRADALSDVRAGLDRFPATAPIRVRVETSRQDSEKEKPKGPERKGEAIVEHGPSGLSVHLEPGQRPQPGTKAERKKREESVARLDPGTAMELVDPAAGIRKLLDGATFVSDGAEPFEGHSVRTVVFRPAQDINEEDRKSIKRYEDVVTLRLDGDGVPIALDRTLDVKVSKLLLTFTVSQRESRRFVRVGSRLVTASATEESSGSGLGQSGGTKTRWIVTPLSL